MIPALRAQFNASYTPRQYQHLLQEVETRAGCPVKYRQSETPCFFRESDLMKMATAGQELVDSLLAHPTYLDEARATIPAKFLVPGEAARPLFVQADFGLIETTSGFEPRLVEIQGFPSLYAYQGLLARAYLDAYDLDRSLAFHLGGLSESGYRALLARAVCGDHDPENVILMEIDPEHQKTLPDFKATEAMLGVPYVCITQLKKHGRKLYYQRDGKLVPVHRIYNRVIVDELERLRIEPPFSWNEDLDVEWAGHPNWFFLLSKFSIPFFRHKCVPRTQLLSNVAALPEDLENYVLKPLFSFAGLGVVVGPTRQQIEAIPAAQRNQYILQERVNFASVIATPHGPTKAEIRIMYLWLENKLQPVNTIIRMGRGKMMGVDHNKNMEWVGASAGLMVTGA
ncbi:MAG: hypothetical protein JST93_00175 [Acidobacteria bacterium]|nr:hypothetical protein [Acidobacteriota bacterium]